MNYDRTEMPTSYDAGRAYPPHVLRYWLEIIAQSVPKGSVSDILDLGCGTGRYSNALADYYAANVVALDPSDKMLTAARRKASARAVRN
jgi:ubiquinone/menaquinone biosynthesis C-methylase UbiE